MIEILKRHAQHLGRQRLGQLSAMLRIQPESVFCELRLYHLPCAAKLAIPRGLDDDAGSTFVRGLRNLEVHVAVSGIHAGLLHEGTGDVKDLEFTPGSRGIRRHEGVLRPTQNGVDPDFLGGDVGDGDVLGGMSKVGDVRLNGQALTEIRRSGLQNAVIASFARAGGEP